MTHEGYIKLYRRIMDDALWTAREPFTKRCAWVDILLSVNHAEAEVVIGMQQFTVLPGESLNSLDTWAKRWNWNKSAVRRFFVLLQEMGKIEIKNESKTTRLTVCKWGTYQGLRNADETQMKRIRNASETHPTPNKNEKNKKNEEEVGAAPILPGTENFELLKRIGAPAAQMWGQADAAAQFSDTERAGLALGWMEYRCQKQRPRTAHAELAELIKQFNAHSPADIRQVVQYSVSGSYTALYFDRLEQRKGSTATTKGPKIIDNDKFKKYGGSGLVKV